MCLCRLLQFPEYRIFFGRYPGFVHKTLQIVPEKHSNFNRDQLDHLHSKASVRFKGTSLVERIS